MTVFVIIPVHNRLADTVAVVEHLRRQTVRPVIVVVDDGSTDGTGPWLASQDDVQVVTSDGSAWWGGAIELGLENVLPRTRDKDFILFLNNDLLLQPDYLERLTALSEANGRCAVGSVVFEYQDAAEVDSDQATLTSLGPRISVGRLRVTDAINDPVTREAVVDLDALSGRGTLYPVEWFARCGTMRPALLPHYFADYEIAARFKRSGCRLIVDRRLGIYTRPVYGNNVVGLSLKDRLFSTRSSSNILHKFMFFWLVGSVAQRATLGLRFPAILAYQAIRALFRGGAAQLQA